MMIDKHTALNVMYGLLLGDALGVPYEFNPPHRIPANVTFDPPAGFERSHKGTPIGTWSDDGAQALALLDAITAPGGYDSEQFADNLLAWYEEGAYTPDGRVFDIGNTTYAALMHFAGGTYSENSGLRSEKDNGNGSLMRTVAAGFYDDPEQVIAVAMAQSRVTHAHPRAQVCCALYSLMIHFLVHDYPHFETVWGAYGWAEASLTSILGERSEYKDELQTVVNHPDEPEGSGYVVDCLFSAIQAVSEADDFMGAITGAVRFGNDTDTTAAVAGALAVAWGFSPEDVIDELIDPDFVETFVESLS